MTKSTAKQDHLRLLRLELRLAGVSIQRFLPPWARRKEVRDHILNELLITMKAPVHEGHIAPFGGIIVPKEVDLGALLPPEDIDLSVARKAADGSSALLVFRENSFSGLLLVDPSSAPDLRVVRTADSLNGIALRRAQSGIVRLYGPFGGLQHAGRRWSASPSMNEAIRCIRQAVPMIEIGYILKILEFAYYVLSPWRIGATLVCLLGDRNPFNSPVDLRSLRMDISSHAALAAHLLAQYDGATVISKDGAFLMTGVHLHPSDKAEHLIPSLPGTRHTSAVRASYDYAEAIVVTVSADGPVTIFSDGLNIFEMGWLSLDQWATSVGKVSGKRVGQDVWADSYDTVCQTCGKTVHIDVLTVTGWREDEEANCPICHEKIAQAHCFAILATIRKAF